MLQYLLKFSLSLVVLFAFYIVVLRPLTFYTWNRFYLLCYSLSSFIIPFINITPWVVKRGVDNSSLVTIIPPLGNYAVYANSNAQPIPATHPVTASQWLLILFCTGVLAMLLRFVMQYRSLRRIRRQSVLLNQNDDVQLFQTAARVNPFSFGNAIYFNNSLHSAEELHKIIQHEFVHVKQKHSVDMLVGELLCIVNWFNPFAWLIRRAIRQNLEFIADNAVITSGLDKKEYQYLLLKVVGITQYSIGNNFNFSNLKKRIAMMNKIKSAKLHLTKFLFVLPLLAVLLLAFRNTVKDRQQEFVFAGIVYDAKTLAPLANVSIHEKYSGVKTRTDGSGFFKIKMGLTAKRPFKISCAYDINGYETAGYNDLSFMAAENKNYAEICFVSMRQKNNPGYNDLTANRHYQLPVDKNNELVPDPDYTFVKSKLDEIQLGKTLSDRIDKLVKNSNNPIWVIDGIPYAVGNSERAWLNKKEAESSPGFKVWVDGRLMSMDEANAIVNRFEIKGLGAYAAEDARKKFGINENVLVLYWKTTPPPVATSDTIPLPPAPAAVPTASLNQHGYLISLADDNGEQVVLVKDKNNKIIKAVSLTEWNNHKKENENLYGKAPVIIPAVRPVPPPPVKENLQPAPAVPANNETVPAIPVAPVKLRAAVGMADKEPLVVVNGQLQPENFDVNSIPPATISAVSVLKDKPAIEKYGAKGNNGVIELTTSASSSAPTGLQHDNGVVTVTGFKIGTAAPVNSKTIHENSDTASYRRKMGLPANVLITLDGKEISANEADHVIPADIDNVYVLQAAAAKLTYGDKGKNGAIEITTKKSRAEKKDNVQYKSDATVHIHFDQFIVNGSITSAGNESIIDGAFSFETKTERPLLIFDGQELPGITTFSRESGRYIMRILNANDGIAKYGEKGKHGVIEITTNKSTQLPKKQSEIEP